MKYKYLFVLQIQTMYGWEDLDEAEEHSTHQADNRTMTARQYLYWQQTQYNQANPATYRITSRREATE